MLVEQPLDSGRLLRILAPKIGYRHRQVQTLNRDVASSIAARFGSHAPEQTEISTEPLHWQSLR
ncbi:MAG TPA: hypothetical protein DCE56_13805 [Cyanobacteria bacterium UBA8553]|nr:hypothetical protein [Cyanobacteria bacterium UBA8553]